jgi:hypothetical protein
MADFSDFENFWIDPETNDLAMDDAGNILGVSGMVRIQQEIKQALSGQKGTDPLDDTLYPDYLNLDPTSPRGRADIAEQIERVPGVAQVETLTSELLDGGNKVALNYRATTVDGVAIGGRVVIP